MQVKKIKKDIDGMIYLRTEGECGDVDYVNITQLVDKINEIIDAINHTHASSGRYGNVCDSCAIAKGLKPLNTLTNQRKEKK